MRTAVRSVGRVKWWLVTLCAALAVDGGANLAADQNPPPPPTKDRGTLALVNKPWTGDFDGMVARRRIRILTPYNRTHYFIDKGRPRGIVYDLGVKLEEDLNIRLKTKPATKIHVVLVPTTRDALYQSLVDGLGDIVAANVTVTPERAKLVDFTIPGKTNVNEIIVTGPGAPALTTLDDLAGKEVTVRDKSIQFESLTTLNATFSQQKKGQVAIKTVPTLLEDEDILEMVNAGLIKTTVVDDFMAEFWKQILPKITLHPSMTVRQAGDVAWAVRKNSPKLVAELNRFAEKHKEGTLFGNMALRTYLQNTKFVKGATTDAEMKKFQSLTEIFKKYSAQYDVDYLLMMAQGYQESQLDQQAKSHVGAVGVMQVMPSTGKDLKVGDISQIDPNIHAGVKYIKFMIDEYFANEPMDSLNKTLFAFASYNAGPARIRQLRRETKNRGLDPNVWFNNVERVVGERIGRETVQYVSNIYKYYVAYTLSLQDQAKKRGGTTSARAPHD
jgi:membrane-bound lytic murein transglycosylase MltF